MEMYSAAQIILPVDFNPPYLTPMLTENSVQHHFRTCLAMLFPTVPDFIGFDEKKVVFDQYENFRLKIFFQKKLRKIWPKVNLFRIVAISKLHRIKQLITPGESKFNADSETGIGPEK